VDDKALKEKLDTMTGTVRYLGIISERLGAQATRDGEILKALLISQKKTEKYCNLLHHKQLMLHKRLTWIFLANLAVLALLIVGGMFEF
jgi:hypothetical protein